MNIEIKLSADELSSIVSDYILKRLKLNDNFKTVKSVKFVMTEKEVGNQLQPHKKITFEGVICEVSSE